MHPARGGELRNRAGALAAFIEIVHTIRFDGGARGSSTTAVSPVGGREDPPFLNQRDTFCAVLRTFACAYCDPVTASNILQFHLTVDARLGEGTNERNVMLLAWSL